MKFSNLFGSPVYYKGVYFMDSKYYKEAREIYEKRQKEKEEWQIRMIQQELEMKYSNMGKSNTQNKCVHKSKRRVGWIVYCMDCGKNVGR